VQKWLTVVAKQVSKSVDKDTKEEDFRDFLVFCARCAVEKGTSDEVVAVPDFIWNVVSAIVWRASKYNDVPYIITTMNNFITGVDRLSVVPKKSKLKSTEQLDPGIDKVAESTKDPANKEFFSSILLHISSLTETLDDKKMWKTLVASAMAQIFCLFYPGEDLPDKVWATIAGCIWTCRNTTMNVKIFADVITGLAKPVKLANHTE